MTPDLALIAELTEFEGDKSRVYLDSNGYPSIGKGHLLTKSELSSGKIIIAGVPVKYRFGLTESQINQLLSQDLTDAENSVTRLVKVPLSQGQWDALVSFTFNVGGGALAGSTLLKILNLKRYDQVPVQIRRWNKNNDGTISKGLQRRREAEIHLWLNENSEGCVHA